VVATTNASARLKIKVQTEAFELGEELRGLSANDTRIGAVTSFIGLMRDFNQEDYNKQGVASYPVEAMYLEHYPGMTEKALQQIANEATQRWPLYGLTIIHRTGNFLPGDQIVLVAAASAHREDSIQCCSFLIDYLKTRAPFWKRERTGEGERWVTARQSDEAASQRWE